MIVFEGADAAGKNTQAKLLAERVSRMGHEVALYSFPRYDTELGKTIRRHLMGETMVTEAEKFSNGALMDEQHHRAPEDPLWFQCAMFADKADAAREIRDHLRAGRFVICDRWTPSATVFGEADGLDKKWLTNVQWVLQPGNVNILLDVSEEETLRRRPVLRDRYEKDRTKQKLVREGYARLWAERQADANEESRWHVVDANGPTVEAVHEQIWQIVREDHHALRRR